MDNNLDVVFLGGLFPKEMYNEIFMKSISGMQNAANNLQWNIVEGLDENLETPVKIFNLMFVGSYPRRYKDIFIKSFHFTHCNGAKDYNIGYLNLTGIKQIILNYVTKKHLKKWATVDNDKSKVLIIYSAQSYFLEAAEYVKKINNKVKICLIVPDLPIYMGLNSKNSLLQSIYKNHQINKVNRKINSIDNFVFLTESMAEYFKVIKPYIVIEGMVSNLLLDQYGYYKNKDSNIKTIVYTGTLTRKYGILELVEAFRNIKKDNYRLIICGDGETKEEIQSIANKDSRVIYKGLLPYEEIKKLQAQATILVNPRKNNEEYTKYSFPSKLMEYLVAGRPVVCYKLDGIPKEYDDYLIYFEDESIQSMTNRLIELCEKDDIETNKIGEKSRAFILEQKNNIFQTKKIIKLINGKLNAN